MKKVNILGAKMSKWIVLPAMGLLLVSLVFGAWTLFLQDTSEVTVSSTGTELPVITANFLGGNINTSSNSDSFNDSFEIVNLNGPINMVASIEVGKTDIEDNCDDYLDDCNVDVFYEDELIANGSTVTVVSGYSKIKTNVSCERLSCPQYINTSVILSI